MGPLSVSVMWIKMFALFTPSARLLFWRPGVVFSHLRLIFSLVLENGRREKL